jgi:hypothetical protein
MKARRRLGAIGLTLLGISAGVAIGFGIFGHKTSDNSNNKEITFTSSKQINDYLVKHIVDAKDDHKFGDDASYSQYLGEDYSFIKNNISLQFFVNANLYSCLLQIEQTENY